MKTIYKYPVPLGTFYLDLPINSKIIRFQEQHGLLCIWVLHSIDEPKLTQNFTIYGTGQPIPYTHQYIASCDQEHGKFIWHLFKV